MVKPPEPPRAVVLPPEPPRAVVKPPEPPRAVVKPPEPPRLVVKPPEPPRAVVKPPEPPRLVVYPPDPPKPPNPPVPGKPQYGSYVLHVPAPSHTMHVSHGFEVAGKTQAPTPSQVEAHTPVPLPQSLSGSEPAACGVQRPTRPGFAHATQAP